jgi:hypothetical protein
LESTTHGRGSSETGVTMTTVIKANARSLRDQATVLEQDAQALQALLQGDPRLGIDPVSTAGADLARRLAMALRSTAKTLEEAG